MQLPNSDRTRMIVKAIILRDLAGFIVIKIFEVKIVFKIYHSGLLSITVK